MDNKPVSEKKSFAGSVVLAVGLVCGLGLLGSQISDSVQNFVDRDRVVTVKGLAEEEVMADYVIWPMTYREMGDDLPAVNARLESRAQQIAQFLTDGGIKPEEITITTPSVDDAQANSYGDNKRPYRYSLMQTMTVATSAVDKVRALIGKQSQLIDQGVSFATDYGYRTQYSFTKLNDIKPKMIETATVNAREVAEKFAKDSGSALGKIRRASQGQFSIYDRDSNTAHIKKVRVVTTVEYYLKD